MAVDKSRSTLGGMLPVALPVFELTDAFTLCCTLYAGSGDRAFLHPRAARRLQVRVSVVIIDRSHQAPKAPNP